MNNFKLPKLVLQLAAIGALPMIGCDVPPGSEPVDEVAPAVNQQLAIEAVQNPNVAAAQAAGATFVGLIPKLPLHVLNQTLGGPVIAMSESLMGCKFPTTGYLDDEDSSNINDLTVNGVSYRRQNALLGGLGHPPSSNGASPGVNSLLSYCQVPVRTLPRTKLDYMVIAAHSNKKTKTIFGIKFPYWEPKCPSGSVSVQVLLDTEMYSSSRIVGNETTMFSPSKIIGKTVTQSWDLSQCNGEPYYTDEYGWACDSFAGNSGSASLTMCFVPQDPNAATELPTAFEVFDGTKFVSQSAQNYIYLAKDAGFEPNSGRAVFFQDGEDMRPMASIVVSDPQYDARVRRIMTISSGSDMTWNLGWGGWNPPIGVAPNYDPPPPPQSCLDNPFNSGCMSTLSNLAAKAMEIYSAF